MLSRALVVVVAIGVAADWLACSAYASPRTPSAGATETVSQALCRLVESSARARGLPVSFFTRLIWQESSFRATAVSPVGAQGIAQFMPGTAQERGLADPFDPEQAIPASASLLRDLSQRFGNLGLAAAAYNGGANRVSAWLAGKGSLPAETRDYVLRITGRSAEDWAAQAKNGSGDESAVGTDSQSCLQLTANLGRSPRSVFAEAPLAHWGVQLAGNFSKRIALATFARARQAYNAVLGNVRPMVIGTRLRHRGLRAFYRVRVPAPTRDAANTLCDRIRKVGGSCVVLPS
jgi:Transglycosylase SLT domain/SPOR domain